MEHFVQFIPHPITVTVDEIGVLTIGKDDRKYRSYDGGFTTTEAGIHGDFELVETK